MRGSRNRTLCIRTTLALFLKSIYIFHLRACAVLLLLLLLVLLVYLTAEGYILNPPPLFHAPSLLGG